ncbi:MAG TPA: metal ABC transporter substrate-binding protein [Salinarimonas sp.]|nr:metal ABC transporter substrate-binding protein [Salinarimonas sp.]
MLSRRTLLAALLSTAALHPAAAGDGNKVKVVATFSIIGDMAREVGGDRIDLATLVGPNGDGHVYSPTPADARRMKEAQVIVANGLKFEGWIGRLVRSSGTKGRLVEAAKGVRTVKVDENAPGHDHGDHSHAGDIDPHAWQSLANGKVYVANIRDALIAADPAGREAYLANAAAYTERLDALDREMRELLGRIPPERRRVITSHDAFGYFAEAYGLAFVAPQGVSTEAEASARDVARIIQQIRREKIGAVFLENVTDARLARRIADETGAKVGGTLYSDALSDPSGPAGTYVEMMRHNARTIAAALVPTQ